jgi:hypothetical protein
MPAAGHPDGERARIVVAADKLHHLAGIAILAHGGAAEFPAPDDQRVLKHAAFLEIAEQRRDGLICFAAAVGEAEVHESLALDVPWSSHPQW